MREFAKFCSPMAIGAAASRVQEQSSARGGRNIKTNQAHIAASVAAKKYCSTRATLRNKSGKRLKAIADSKCSEQVTVRNERKYIQSGKRYLQPSYIGFIRKIQC